MVNLEMMQRNLTSIKTHSLKQRWGGQEGAKNTSKPNKISHYQFWKMQKLQIKPTQKAKVHGFPGFIKYMGGMTNYIISTTGQSTREITAL